jgi:hypothetical protein
MPGTNGDRDDQTWSHLADLARETFERQVKLGREYAELARSSLTGEGGGDRSEAGRAYLSAVRREGEHYWREVSSIGLSYASEVAVLGAKAAGAVARDVRSAMARSGTTSGRDSRHEHHHDHDHHEHHHNHDHGSAGPDGSPPSSSAGSSSAGSASPPDQGARPRVEVALHGPVGQTATARITVANKHPRPRRITLQAGPIRDADGTEVDAEVDVSPRRVTVPAGEETTVTLELVMASETFAPGVAYICIVEVSGGEEATVVVHIRLDAAA